MPAVNRKNESDLDVAFLRQVLSYDAETGIFRWREPQSFKVRPGQIAGYTRKTGYQIIRVSYSRFLAHRLAWFYVHGAWPAADIDHINGDRNDNRLVNLREATRQQNSFNSKVRSHNKSGHRNIRPWKRKFQVIFSRAGKRIFHKSYPSLAAAIIARDHEYARLNGEFSVMPHRREN